MLVDFLVPNMSHLTQNEFIVQDFFTFADEILTQGGHLDMASLDVDSLFINI